MNDTTIITPNTNLFLGYSRIILLARNGVRLDIMNNCMDELTPAIWVKIITRGRKPLVIGGVYREFHLLLQQQPNNTDEIRQQINRWKRTVRGWKKASRDSKCILLGDINLDYTKWNDGEYRLKKLVQIVKEEIETEGFCQILRKITRS